MDARSQRSVRLLAAVTTKDCAGARRRDVLLRAMRVQRGRHRSTRKHTALVRSKLLRRTELARRHASAARRRRSGRRFLS